MIGVVDHISRHAAYHKRTGEYKITGYSLTIKEDNGMARDWISHADGGTIEVLEQEDIK